MKKRRTTIALSDQVVYVVSSSTARVEPENLVRRNAVRRVMDTLTRRQRSERMALIRSKDTKPELLVRKLARSCGYKFRLHDSDLPGKPDLVFSRHRKVVFIHGCFWHRHSSGRCALARLPKSKLIVEGREPEVSRSRTHHTEVGRLRVNVR